MKNTQKIVTLALAALILVVSLSSCKTKLVFDNGSFYCSKNNVTYVEVDFQYLPVSIGTEKYGELVENNVKTDIFTVENASPEKWLATADGRLFCAAGEKFPHLRRWSQIRS